MAPSNDEALTQALIAVDSLVGTLHLALAVTEDAPAAEALRTSLMAALTARTVLEDRVAGDPVKEPQRPGKYEVMGQAEEEPVIRLGPDPDTCDHENVVQNMDGGGRFCVACGEDPDE